MYWYLSLHTHICAYCCNLLPYIHIYNNHIYTYLFIISFLASHTPPLQTYKHKGYKDTDTDTDTDTYSGSSQFAGMRGVIYVFPVIISPIKLCVSTSGLSEFRCFFHPLRLYVWSSRSRYNRFNASLTRWVLLPLIIGKSVCTGTGERVMMKLILRFSTRNEKVKDTGLKSVCHSTWFTSISIVYAVLTDHEVTFSLV